MKCPLYQVDAFASGYFTGNPAAVCLVDEWPSDSLMQAIAAENQLSETAFVREGTGSWGLRWFTPETEVDLCGHATLASAYVLFRYRVPRTEKVTFETKSGELYVTRERDGLIAMDMPTCRAEPCEEPVGMRDALGAEPCDVLAATRDYLVVLDSEKELRELVPDYRRIAKLDKLGVIVTARASGYDFVSRFFAPSVGVLEDPVTGSAHCTLTPYWAERLGKNELTGFQASKRGGKVHCTEMGDRTRVAGQCQLFLQGTILVG